MDDFSKMSQIDTETLFQKILLFQAKFERFIENLRQELAGMYSFEPYKVFRMIDKDSKGFLTEEDLLLFLK